MALQKTPGTHTAPAEPSTQEPARTPTGDILVGAFFLAWAAAGWLSIAFNDLLFSDLYAGLDPGPSLMPVLVLGALSLGGLSILASGLVSLFKGEATRGGSAAAEGTGWRRHLVPLGLLATLAVYPTIMEALGYVPATALFVFGWICALTGRRAVSQRGERLLALAVALFSTAVIVGILYLGFVVVIHAPLP